MALPLSPLRMSHPGWGSLVIEQQLMEIATLQPPCTRNMVLPKQWSSMNCEYVLHSCSETKLGGVEQCETPVRAMRIPIEDRLQREKQQVLWESFFLDSTLWWDNRPGKSSPRHSDLRHTLSEQVLWLDNCFEPAWVDSQLAMWDAGMQEPSTPGNVLRSGARYGGVSKVEALRNYFEEGELVEAVEALDILVQQAFHVDNFFFYRLLKRCNTVKDLVLGRRVHALALKSGYESNTFLANHIICMYASYGRLDEAMQVFKKVAVPDCYMWSSIILAYARHGQGIQAIKLYRQMRESTMKSDSHIYVAVLHACAMAQDLASGKEVHADILSSLDEPNVFVNNGLVDMYSKCASLENARRVFDSLPTKDVVTWTAMLTGYSQYGLGQEALALYASMQDEGIKPADQTFVCLLKACASVGAICEGKKLHAQIQERGLEANMVVGNCLVDMYAKCGSLREARRVFDKLPLKDVVTWTAMLNGYAEHSDTKMTMQCFEDMLHQGVEPNDTTFICLLVACSHAGWVHQGQQYFKLMEDHGILPNVHHHNCMVDLLGRSGHLDDAEDILRITPFDNNVGWISLLSACKSYGDVECGERCFNHLIKLQPDNASPYVLLANIYANAGMWRDVDRIESLRKCAGAEKKPGKACIEVKNKVHEFTVGEDRLDISSKLKIMRSWLKEGGHVPQTELVLKAVSELEKEDELCGHAEKLALAYGLLNTRDGTTLLVTKNLRMCNDCHGSTKIMSRLEKREIVVRDAHRVHHFVNGSCSCGDRH